MSGAELANLLALHHFGRLGPGHDGYIRLAALPALGAVAGTVAVLWVLHRGELCGRYLPDAPPDPHDRVLLRGSGLVCLAVGPLFAAGLNPALVACPTASSRRSLPSPDPAAPRQIWPVSPAWAPRGPTP